MTMWKGKGSFFLYMFLQHDNPIIKSFAGLSPVVSFPDENFWNEYYYDSDVESLGALERLFM